ncbi:C40 family peptidase [Cellulomonas hominis]|uniref:C40 family peptidase n=1 Tax=Cellulomonas hominis TaxID=156981 RepID=UPI001B91334B|nr:C40 family peptidase [Cellulomonas hominis]VTR77189.1 Gamma-D-glutamyl-L-lysine endopeptidase [Cellulomonas hominis]
MPTRHTTAARHRADGRALTVLTDVRLTAAHQLTSTTRRTGAVVASSGLAVSFLAAPALADDEVRTTAVDVSALTEAARAIVDAAPVVAAPAEATWTFENPGVTAVTPPPPPPPVVEEEPEPEEAASRSRWAEPEAPAAEPAPEPVGAPAPASANGSAIVEIASSLVGIPYVWGGTNPAGFDCSGFTSYVYAQVGITLPRTSGDQRYAGVEVPRDQAQPGDLIWSPGHISIYAGGNLQVDAPVPGKSIQIREIWQSSPKFIRVG